MSDRRMIFVVTSGEYSDYGLDAVYETAEDAQACANRIGGRVEEYPLYPPGDDSFRDWRRVHAQLSVSPDGVIDDEPGIWTGEQRGDTEPEPTHYRVHNSNGTFYVSTSGRDTEQALKAVRERASQVAALLAEGGDPMQMENYP